MKPAQFEYHRPQTVAEAVALLGTGEEPKLLAGGQSLVPLLNMRLAQPTDLIDLGFVSGLDAITVDADGISIGAMTRQVDAERSPEIARRAPLLLDALRHIAHPQIRARGTVGGSIAHADPAAELPAALLALEGELVCEGPAGRRTIAATDFFKGFLTTALDPDEILVEARIPNRDAEAGCACVEVTRRKGDYALAGAMVILRIVEQRIDLCRIVIFSLGEVPVRARTAEHAVGEAAVAETWRQVAATAAAAVDPGNDLQSTSAYRKHLASVVVRRALEQAARRYE